MLNILEIFGVIITDEFYQNFLNSDTMLTELSSEKFVLFGPSPIEPFNQVGNGDAERAGEGRGRAVLRQAPDGREGPRRPRVLAGPRQHRAGPVRPRLRGTESLTRVRPPS